VFQSATVDVNILLFAKEENRRKTSTRTIQNVADLKTISRRNIMAFSSSPWVILPLIERKIMKKIKSVGVLLKDWDVQIYRGILTGFNQAFIIDGTTRDALVTKSPKCAEILKPMLNNDAIKKYRIDFEDRYLINSHNGDKKRNIPPVDLPNDYPVIHQHILDVLTQLKKGERTRKRGHTGYNKDFFARSDQGDTPFNLRDCAYLDKFDCPKIIWKQTSAEKTFTFDDHKHYLDVTGQMLTSSTNDTRMLKYILGFLNSRMVDFYIRNSATAFGATGMRWIPQFMLLLPIPKPDSADVKKIAALVDKVLSRKREGKDTTQLESDIDALVYELYGLTNEEIAVIEG
jgi:hypothetical protein